MNGKQLQSLQATLAAHRPTLMDSKSTYAVLCPLLWKENQWHLLFEVRAASLRRQPKEVCFPGGRMEAGETPTQAALRETREELSIPQEAITVLGELDFVVHVSGFLLHPVLAVVEDESALLPMPAEVDHCFTVPLSFFRETKPASAAYGLAATVPEDFPYALLDVPNPYPFRPSAVESPVWVYEGHAIWGLTARMVRNILSFSGLS